MFIHNLWNTAIAGSFVAIAFWASQYDKFDSSPSKKLNI